MAGDVEVEQMRRFRADSLWLVQHEDELRKKYPDQYVAVNNEKVVTNGKNCSTVLAEAEKQGVNPASLVVQWIFARDILRLL